MKRGDLVTVATAGDYGKPRPETGLRELSQAMIDKIMAVRRNKCGPVIGRIDASLLKELGAKLAVVVGIAD